MEFEGAVIREQGITFAVVIVKKHVLENGTQANSAIQSFGVVFPGVPIVLMAQDSRGTPSYFGRQDISRFMARVPVRSVPWKRYILN